MDKNPDITNFAVLLIIKAVVIAARFSGIVRKRSLKRLAAMEVDAKDKEIIFLRDMVEQLQMQVSILQKRIKKKQKKPRHTLRERLFILWQMETYVVVKGQ
ncbi:MAG TPA: hypothetical protein VMW72_00065 [Sedimentisphaerales bacterium]|nr:hypothetical protein [Sedimentisphaerales bacterium]